MTQALTLRFEDALSFAREYQDNIEKGGAFVRTDTSLELREVVVVEVELGWCGKRESLDAEVVHIVPGHGAAVQFLRPAAALRERFEQYLEGPQEEPDEAGGPLTSQDLTEAFVADGPLEGASEEPVAGERRAAARGAARLSAELAATGVSLRGRTRDISEGGVLVSADGSDVPVGKQVRLSLRDPETGEEVEVTGKVARHVEGEGTVAAVAVEFDDPGRETLTRFVAAARERERERTERGVGGPIEELGGASPVEVFGRAVPRGTLTLCCGAEEGVVAFEDGSLVYAGLGSLSGVKALSRMLAWREGRFLFHSRVEKVPGEKPMPLEKALGEALRQKQAAAPTAPRELSMSSRLRFHRDVQAREGLELGELEQAVIELVQARFTVRRILDVIPETDATLLGTLRALLDLGVLSLDEK